MNYEIEVTEDKFEMIADDKTLTYSNEKGKESLKCTHKENSPEWEDIRYLCRRIMDLFREIDEKSSKS